MIKQEKSVTPADSESVARSIDIRQRASVIIATTRTDRTSCRTIDEPVVKRASSRADRAYWRWMQRHALLEGHGVSRRINLWQFTA